MMDRTDGKPLVYNISCEDDDSSITANDWQHTEPAFLYDQLEVLHRRRQCLIDMGKNSLVSQIDTGIARLNKILQTKQVKREIT